VKVFLSRLAALAAALLLTRGASAQQGRGEHVTNVEVTLVEVPVYAEKDGEPVRDLSKEDFELSADGRRVDILGFDRVELDAPPRTAPAGSAEGAAPVPPAARRQFLFLFDLAFSRPIQIGRARAAAQDFVENGLKPSDVAAVATYDAERGLKLILSFTGDRFQIADAIRTLGLEKRLGEVRPDPLGLALDVAPLKGDPEGRKGMGDAAMLEMFQHLDAAAQKGGDEQKRGRVLSTVGAFQDLARALDSVKGRKQVLYFSEGIDNRLLVGEAGANAGRDTADAVAHGETWKVDSDARYGRSDVSDRLKDMMAVFVRADCVIHPVDVSGLGDSASTGQASLGVVGGGAVIGDHSSGRKDVLFMFAKETGGTLIEKSNDLTGQLASLEKKTSVTYVLAFAPGASEPGKFHALKVKVKRPGVRVSTRPGWFEPVPFAKRAAVEKRLATAQLVAFGAPRNEFGTRLVTAGFPTRRAGAFQLPVLVEVPGTVLVSGSTAPTIPVEIYAYLLDHDLKVVDFATQVLSFDVKKFGDALKNGGFKYYATLEAPAGEYTLRVLVRDGANGRTDLKSQHIALAASEKPELLTPFFHEAPGSPWIHAKGAQRPDLASEDEPFASGGSMFVPAALPRVSPGSAARLSLVGYRLPAGDVAVSGTVRDAAGKDLGPAHVKLDGSERTGDGARRLAVSFAPEGLAAGMYELSLRVTAGADAVTAPPARFVVGS
jgi:VWFA-related protein